jgi:hypothetical protein
MRITREEGEHVRSKWENWLGESFISDISALGVTENKKNTMARR